MCKSVRSLIFLAALFCAVSSLSASPYVDTLPDGSINTGAFSLFTVLTSGDLNDTNNTVTGPSLVIGNVGVGGKGNLTMSDGTINGDIYMNSTGHFSKSGPATHNGTLFLNQDTVLNAALNDARSLSMAAASEASTANYLVTQGSFNGSTVKSGQSITITANPFAGSKVVLNLQDFVMTGGTFTLSGGATTTFIINVSRNFSLNNSSVILSGGLMASHVLFNVMGSGSQVSLNQGTSLQGILLATSRKISLSGGKVYGKVIAEQIAITSGGQVISQ
jgi:hypothetical protein